VRRLPDPVQPGAETSLYSWLRMQSAHACACFVDVTLRAHCLQYTEISSQIVPPGTPRDSKACQGTPTGSLRDPKVRQGNPTGFPRDPQGTLKGPQGLPKEAPRPQGQPKGSPKVSQGTSKGGARDPNGPPWHPPGGSRATQGTPSFLKKHFFIFWDTQNPEKNTSATQSKRGWAQGPWDP
jgi:hypothetical protein